MPPAPARHADTVTLAPAAAASIASQSAPVTITPTIQLTPQEALAVSVAAQTAATQQTSLAPLFANLGVAAGLAQPAAAGPAGGGAGAGAADQPRSKPDRQRHQAGVPELRPVPGGLAGVRIASPSPATTPDLKAALIVLRQVLATSLNGVTAPPGRWAASGSDGARHHPIGGGSAAGRRDPVSARRAIRDGIGGDDDGGGGSSATRRGADRCAAGHPCCGFGDRAGCPVARDRPFPACYHYRRAGTAIDGIARAGAAAGERDRDPGALRFQAQRCRTWRLSLPPTLLARSFCHP